MQRIAIDYGRARVGVAIGMKIAREYATYSSTEALQKIADLVTEEDVNEVIVGRPVRSQGEPGTLDAEIEQFVADLKARLPNVSIITTDEAFSSSQAEIELTEAGVKPDQISQRIDQYAAKIILEQYNEQEGRN